MTVSVNRWWLCFVYLMAGAGATAMGNDALIKMATSIGTAYWWQLYLLSASFVLSVFFLIAIIVLIFDGLRDLFRRHWQKRGST